MTPLSGHLGGQPHQEAQCLLQTQSWVTPRGFCLGEFLLVNFIFKLVYKAAGSLMARPCILRARETFETWRHAAKAGLKITMLLKMTLHFLFS